jgi:hypothetical protein
MNNYKITSPKASDSGLKTLPFISAGESEKFISHLVNSASTFSSLVLRRKDRRQLSR